MSASWWLLLLAGAFEIVWATGLKYTEDFTRPLPSVLTLIALAASLYLLARATETLPIGTAYAVWVGIGALGTALFGILLFEEPLSFTRIFFFGLLFVAIVGLKFNAA